MGLGVLGKKKWDLDKCHHSGTNEQPTKQGKIELLSQWTMEGWDEQKTISEDWMHQTLRVMNGIQRSCTSCYYIWFRKNTIFGNEPSLSHYYNSTWQLLTDSDRNESNSQKRRKLLFWWQLTFIDGWRWRGREPTYSRCVTSKGSN